MAEPTKTAKRPALTREGVLAAAITLADRGGIDALTMRALAEALHVEAMSLYHHVANKEALLDGLAEVVVQEVNERVSPVEVDLSDGRWVAVMRARILTARTVMLDHRWVPAILPTRTTMSRAVLTYFHGLLAVLRAGGFSHDLAHHALHALGSRALGFSQELFDPTGNPGAEQANDQLFALMADQVPLLMEMLSEISHDDPESSIGWCDDQTEFEFALDVLLDGLERRRLAAAT